jgi:hypothetical protein
MGMAGGGVTIRPGFPDDAHALTRLAALDSAPRQALAGPVLVAEVDGALVAAVALRSGRVVADPFRPTAELVELLRRRATQLTAADVPSRRSWRRRRALARVAARRA